MVNATSGQLCVGGLTLFSIALLVLVGIACPPCAMALAFLILPCLLTCLFCVGRPELITVVPMSSLPLLTEASGESDETTSAPRVAKLQNRRSHHDQSMQQCEIILQRLRTQDARQAQGVAPLINERHSCVFTYKNRWLKGNVLHYAVWRASREDLAPRLAHVVRALTVNASDPFYQQDFAADALRLVLQSKADINAYAECGEQGPTSRYDAIHLAAGLGCVQAMRVLLEFVPEQGRLAIVNKVSLCAREGALMSDSTPLGEAAWHGQIGAMTWLLRHSADASVIDKEGKSALHLLAFRGGSGAELADVVRQLLERKACLDLTTGPNTSDANQANKKPLEIASLPGSQFPRQCMYLLATSWHQMHSPGGQTKVSFLDDILALSSRGAADVLAEQLVHKPEFHDFIRLNAQEHDGPNKMANLVYRAPLAAAHILQILTVMPIVPDPMRSPISSRASLKGLFENVPMRCTYQSDVIQESAFRPRWPMWFIWANAKQSLGFTRPWQYDFLSDVYKPSKGGRQEDVYDVEMKVVLLPNIVDLDILWALARTWNYYDKVFLKLPIQGLITCLWSNIVEPVYLLEMSFKAVEVVSLIILGASSGRNKWEGDEDVPVHLSICWTILGAAWLKEVFKWMKHLLRYTSKSVRWKQYDGREETEWKKSSMWPQWSKSLWSMRAFFGATAALPELGFQIVPFFLLLLASGGGKWAVLESSLLAANIMLRGFRVLIMLRPISGIGRKIVALLNTFVAGSMFQMLVITGLLFWIIVAAAAALDKDTNITEAAAGLYRGLIFGDGDGLDFMDLKYEADATLPYKMKSSLMLGASLLYYIIILNLIIAVYEKEYQRVTSKALMTFHQLRASLCCKFIMELSLLSVSVRALEKVPFAGGFWCIIAFMLASGLVLPAIQRDSIAFCIVGAVLLACAQIGWQMAWMRNRWVSPYRDKDYFLWICHRADYDDERNRADNDGEVDSADVEELHRRLEAVESRLEAKLDCLIQMQGAPMQAQQMQAQQVQGHRPQVRPQYGQLQPAQQRFG
mmetsp:Transcript_87517/g.245788  ORF Transcript_87517/g.245788 Transcript_87517/m.245788 type:complete len:1030 (-) Transcript_87517:117-3206(-)